MNNEWKAYKYNTLSSSSQSIVHKLSEQTVATNDSDIYQTLN